MCACVSSASNCECAPGVFACQTGFFKPIVLGVYLILFGAATIVMEIFFPPALASWFGFYGRWLGRGFWFIFLVRPHKKKGSQDSSLSVARRAF